MLLRVATAPAFRPCRPLSGREFGKHARRGFPFSRAAGFAPARWTSSEAIKPTSILPWHFVTKDWVRAILPYKGYAAYSLLSCGFMLTDVLALRFSLAVGYSLLTAYHLLQLSPLKIPLAGSLFFSLVNLYIGMKIYVDGFVALSEEEMQIYEKYFESSMSEREFKRVLEQGELLTTTVDEHILIRGEPNESLYMIIDGKAEVELDTDINGETMVIAEPCGSMLGEITCLGVAKVATATVTVTPGCRYLRWKSFAEMRNHLQREPAVLRALEVMIAKELATKLHRQTEMWVNERSVARRVTERIR
jgi:CRP-like cAMP-binding protein